MNGLRSELLDFLACPHCHGSLLSTKTSLDCKTCVVSYPIQDGIPIFFTVAESSSKE